MTNMMDLAERVESGTGENRVIDGQIAAATLPANAQGWKPWATSGGYVLTETGEKPRPGMGQFVAAPNYTASLDAAVALLERVLPGWLGDLDIGASGYFVARLASDDGDFALNVSSQASSPARALLAAILKARALSTAQPDTGHAQDGGR